MASRRRYLTQSQLAEYADVEIVDTAEADDQISQAEEMIDAYVGTQRKHISVEYAGQATGGSTTTLVDTSADTPLNMPNDYFNYCEVEIVGGTNKGEKRQVISSDRNSKTITVSEPFSAAIDDTSVYIIRQIGKFPRENDIFYLADTDSYYKTIPEAVTRAVAAQVQYIIEKGAEFFAGATDFGSESIGDYSYSIRENAERLISPKARSLLKGIASRIGTLLV